MCAYKVCVIHQKNYHIHNIANSHLLYYHHTLLTHKTMYNIFYTVVVSETLTSTPVSSIMTSKPTVIVIPPAIPQQTSTISKSCAYKVIIHQKNYHILHVYIQEFTDQNRLVVLTCPWSFKLCTYLQIIKCLNFAVAINNQIYDYE